MDVAALSRIRSPGRSPAPARRAATRRVARSSSAAVTHPRRSSHRSGRPGSVSKWWAQARGRVSPGTIGNDCPLVCTSVIGPDRTGGPAGNLLAMRGRRAVTVVLVAALGLLGAGVACGDSKGVSKADYLARAREVCQRGSAALTAASNEALAKVPPGQKLSGAAIDEFVRQTVVPTIREQIKELRGLEAPKGEKAHVDEIY